MRMGSAFVGVFAVAVMSLPASGSSPSATRVGSPQLDPDLVDCSSFISNSQRLCLAVADELDGVLDVAFAQLLAGDLVSGFAEATPATMITYPDGEIHYGLAG